MEVVAPNCNVADSGSLNLLKQLDIGDPITNAYTFANPTINFGCAV